MPNWSDDEGRYWWAPPGAPYYNSVQIPHPPFPQEGCNCACCRHGRGTKSMVEVIQFNKQSKPVHEVKVYTGIGSRETPDDVLKLMARIGCKLGEKGWTLRSGHAPGADQAFEHGAQCSRYGNRPDNGRMEIYLPWEGFEGANHDGVSYFNIDRFPVDLVGETYRVARQFHPNWHACSPGARKLHARNVFQIGGRELSLASTMVICWTKGGKRGGGTGQALRIAEHLKIPIFDLAVCTQGQVINFVNHGVLP